MVRVHWFCVMVALFGVSTAYSGEPDLINARGQDKVFVLQTINGKTYKRWVPDRKTMDAFKFKFSDVKVLDTGALDDIPNKDPLPSFLERPRAVTVDGNKVYLVSSDDRVFHVPDRTTLKRLRYDIDKVPTISQTRFNSYTLGTPLPALPER